MNRKSLSLTALVFSSLFLTGLALAHTGATGIVKERMDSMKSIGDAMKVMAAMVKGEQAYSGTAASEAAQTIAGHAHKIPHQFPEGSLHKPSEAAPAIWKNWNEFVTLASKLENDAKTLAEAASAAETAKQILPQLTLVSASCKSCHKTYRIKK